MDLFLWLHSIFWSLCKFLNFPFFLGTTTINDNQVASSRGYIHHVDNNLLVLFFNYNIVLKNIYLTWSANGIDLSSLIRCCANFGVPCLLGLYTSKQRHLCTPLTIPSNNSCSFKLIMHWLELFMVYPPSSS
jgi:hypothetical protein